MKHGRTLITSEREILRGLVTDTVRDLVKLWTMILGDGPKDDEARTRAGVIANMFFNLTQVPRQFHENLLVAAAGVWEYKEEFKFENHFFIDETQLVDHNDEKVFKELGGTIH